MNLRWSIVFASLMFLGTLGTGVLWIGSLDHDVVIFSRLSSGFDMTVYQGRLEYLTLLHHSQYYHFNVFSMDLGPFPNSQYVPGFEWQRTNGGASVDIPLWFFMLLFGVTGFTLLMQQRRKVFERGKCRECGYDLRASRDRCPECGTPIGGRAVELLK